MFNQVLLPKPIFGNTEIPLAYTNAKMFTGNAAKTTGG